MIEDLWYKNAVVYCVDVETFQDGNGDGIGDFRGLARRLDYLAGLGVTCLWLLPFYPSPNRDNGYDIADFYGVDPRLGDLGDFVAFSHQCKLHGIRVIVDLVINHTSDRHPWFQQARADASSRFRDYYVWSAKKPRGAHKGMVFPGVQQSIWTRDKKAGAYYFHRFHEFQPDLNLSNPAVRDEIRKVMGFWLELGVSGFRVDAVPFLISGPGKAVRKGDPFAFLREMRQFLSWRCGDAVLLAEANVPMDEVLAYFGDEGDHMQLVFNFLANQHLFLSLVDEDTRPLVRVLRSMPKLPPTAQWASFLRNHDELDLGRLTQAERKRAFAALGPDPRMQLYDRGLRRRLAPMLGGDPRRLQLAYSLMFSLPGTPVIWYGEEIGMGERLALRDRHAVRTPMQWSSEHHGGFTHGRAPFRPLVDRGAFGFERVNVAAQRRDPESLLNWIERMIRLRKECPELGWGSARVLPTGDPSVLAMRYDFRGAAMLTLHNFASNPRSVRVAVGTDAKSSRLIDLLSGDDTRKTARGGRHRFELEGYGYRWFRLGAHDSAHQRVGQPGD
jgi:maltose alpha-D-glucosyltransferase / alpha-amylase